MSELYAAIAVTRFGLGARQGELKDALSDPKGWLRQQLKTQAILLESPGTSAAVAGLPAMQDMRTMAMDDKKALQKQRRQTRRQIFQQEFQTRSAFAAETSAPFAERWVRFWSNHFTVSARKTQIEHLVGEYERNAIRPHIFGSFSTLLEKAVLGKAMVLYLDNDRSLGPNSTVGKVQARKGKNRGLNENLAREVLELHTLGVGGGYQQSDVEGFAKALTGWTIERGKKQGQATGEVIFRSRFHEPGAKTILGKAYQENGPVEAKNILLDLSRHPATAAHIAKKLAIHFVSDTPPEQAIETLSQVFRDTRGDLSELAKAVINLDSAWSPQQQKFKTPDELLISITRAFGTSAYLGPKNAQNNTQQQMQQKTQRNTQNMYKSLGQLPMRAPSPAGWEDSAASWAGPDAIKKRLELSNQIAQRAPENLTAQLFLDQALGTLATPDLRQAVARAESQTQALILALMSPEFQRR